MKWPRNRFLLLPYVVLLIAFVLVGCTSKEDPAETLAVSGNHSTGNLTMVTTDTSSDGYHYLNPQLSPDQSTILFTGDWWAIPTVRDPGDGAFVTNRQILTIPMREGKEPNTGLLEQGAELVFLDEISLPISGRSEWFTETQDFDTGNPVWENDTHILFWMNMGQIGTRLFRADISDATLCPIEILFLEPTDANPSPVPWQHMDCTLSPNKRWLAFTRFGCTIPDSFETCSGVAIHILDMETAGQNDGYDAVTYAMTNEFSRIEAPKWSPFGDKIIFSGGMDVAGAGVGSGTEIFTLDVDTLALEAGNPVIDDNRIKRLTFTTMTAGDPISGIVNTGPVYSNDGSRVYFVSTRRAPTTTLHDRNIWSMPSDGRLDPEIYYFTRSDDVDPFVMPNGNLLFSSALGFPTEMLVRLEEEAYQSWALENEEDDLGLDEVQLRELAAEEIQNIEFFEGVMSHIYTFTK